MMTATTKWYGMYELSNHIFKENYQGHEMILGLEESVKNNKELFSFCFQLFCNGLVMLYGDETKVLLNALTMEQLNTIRTKLKCVRIHLKMVTYDIETAHLLDIVDKTKLNEGAVLAKSMAEINNKPENESLEDYSITLLLHGNVMQFYFEIY
jgi:hypothetical protein